ncbi:hypothetical protein AVEN_224104-2 [Araneus ventricosus]|uniref:Uncharacterized protein n=1 Tax=Araneus ventricosus TaxID=182803 RepID=A0A4Y2DZ07_ARAVE|nr:hypothetical protein AVEN_224104-2 [Araneus ventricosus]
MPIDEATETPKCSPGTSNTVSPFDISPVPNIKKRTTTRGRKATRSSLITGSPYKDQLTKSLGKSAPKKRPWVFPGIMLQRWKVASQQCESCGWEESFTGVKELVDGTLLEEQLVDGTLFEEELVDGTLLEEGETRWIWKKVLKERLKEALNSLGDDGLKRR